MAVLKSVAQVRTLLAKLASETAATIAGATDITGTDLAATTATTVPVVSSASHNFVAADVGLWLHITAGSNWTPGYYQIISVGSNDATLSAACGTSTTLSSGTWAETSIVNVTAHGYSVGDVLVVVGTTGMTTLNGMRTVATVPDSAHFTMTDFITGLSVFANGSAAGGSPTSARVKVGLTPGDLEDIMTTLSRMNVKTTGQDENRANESTISTILAA